MANLAIHGAHNASLAVENNGELVVVVEFERWLSNKNCGFTSMYPVQNLKDFIVYEILEYIKDKYGISEYENCYYQDADINCFNKISCKNFIDSNQIGTHHGFHAYGSFYQFDLNEALCISYDGGAPDGYFHIYKMQKNSKAILLKTIEMDLGSNYGFVGSLCDDIKTRQKCNLIYAGKVMGLQSYGSVHEEWKESFKKYYRHIPWWRDVDVRAKEMISSFGLKLNANGQLEGKEAWDFCATSQAAFEDLVFESIDDIVQANPNLPICVTGGCALNIVMNSKIKERYQRDVYVAPNSSDCGLSVGMLLASCQPKGVWDVTYAGTELMDRNMLMRYVDARGGRKLSVEAIVDDLVNHKIYGIVQGTAEHGPRALGNRSIICNPMGDHVKDTLNAKVKHREWYRPFAPIVRLEDVSEYFEWEGETRWMNFCPNVKEEYKTKLPAITHVDNTARVQTITREQNPLMYDLLTVFKQKTGMGVLLNTSFNVDGKPILSTIVEAFQVFDNTQLDKLYIEGFVFIK